MFSDTKPPVLFTPYCFSNYLFHNIHGLSRMNQTLCQELGTMLGARSEGDGPYIKKYAFCQQANLNLNLGSAACPTTTDNGLVMEAFRVLVLL